MNILIVNDDGIRARGIQELIRSLGAIEGSRIYVCAPDGQRSASGHGITMMETMRVEEAAMDDVEIAYQTSGLPADCVKIGLELFERAGVDIDMVFSGINHGGNLGTDTLYSGTVAGAIEGSLNGIPSVAVSVDSHEAEYFELACELAVNAAVSIRKHIETEAADPSVVLNINTPNRPKEEIRGLKITRLGSREYDEEFAPLDGGENMTVPGQFKYFGTPVHYEGLPNEIDVVASQEGYASITPMRSDMTYHDKIEEIKKWELY